LTISRNEEKQTHCFNVIPKINEALKILQSNIPATIDFQQNVWNDKLMVNGDPTQIQRVVFNLVMLNKPWPIRRAGKGSSFHIYLPLAKGEHIRESIAPYEFKLVYPENASCG
jgi:hypothetical protein